MDNKEEEFKTTLAPGGRSYDDDVDLLGYVRVVLKYRRMILSVCVVAVAATVTVKLLSPKIYAASASVVPPMDILQQESELTGGLGMGGSRALQKAIGVTSIADMYVGILESRAVADILVERFDLMNVYEGDGLKSTVRRTLANNTYIEVSDEGIVRVTVEDEDPNRAAAMANAYVEELDRQNKRLSAGQATSKRVFLENRLGEVEDKLSKIENILSREAKTQEMLYEMLTREYEIAKIEEAKNMPTIQVLDEAIVPEMRMPRGTIRASALAGLVSFILAVLIAFARESLAKMREVETGEQGGERFAPGRHSNEDGTFDELESKREIVASQRRRRKQESKLHSQEA
jgi:uncharacterized protein involved in exopolysaccharide biosynthesis